MIERPYSREMLELAEKMLRGTITPEEKSRLFQWYDTFDDTELTLDTDQAAAIGRLKEEMLRDIRKKSGIGQESGHQRGKIHRLTQISAAAAILLLLFTGGWFLRAHSRNKSTSLAATIPPKNTTDIAPGSNKAILTLGDGSTVTLDSTGTGRLSIQGNVQVIKSGHGQLQYASAGEEASTREEPKVVYNILSTPKGGQYRLQLQDGTNVWLNAGSSIRYPTAFTGNERKVEVTGEAYFEVAKNATMPFKVTAAGPAGEQTDIEVLGTSFNINAYKDEPDQETSLLEGAVRVTRSAASVLLKPAQQAVATGKTLKTTTPANIEQAIAWKNGAFEFEGADVPAIMRQIARWYDVEVVYEGKAPEDKFTGRFSRNTSLTGVLQILHLSGVRLAAENKKIVIKA